MPKSLFTAKHYRFIAKAIQDSRIDNDTVSAYGLILILTTIFRLDNPRFDADAFRTACGEQPVHSD